MLLDWGSMWGRSVLLTWTIAGVGLWRKFVSVLSCLPCSFVVLLCWVVLGMVSVGIAATFVHSMGFLFVVYWLDSYGSCRFSAGFYVFLLGNTIVLPILIHHCFSKKKTSS